MMIRYCPSCDEEFRPEILRCSDCGGDLVDRDPEALEAGGTAEAPQGMGGAGGASAGPEVEYATVLRDLTSEEVKHWSKRLARAGIPFRLTVQGYAMHL